MSLRILGQTPRLDGDAFGQGRGQLDLETMALGETFDPVAAQQDDRAIDGHVVPGHNAVETKPWPVDVERGCGKLVDVGLRFVGHEKPRWCLNGICGPSLRVLQGKRKGFPLPTYSNVEKALRWMEGPRRDYTPNSLS
jgi:hypothetical protein